MEYQAYALVKTPDYAYLNPVPGTRASCEAASRRLAEDYARRVFISPYYPTWRAERFLRELSVLPLRPGADAT